MCYTYAMKSKTEPDQNSLSNIEKIRHMRDIYVQVSERIEALSALQKEIILAAISEENEISLDEIRKKLEYL